MTTRVGKVMEKYLYQLLVSRRPLTVTQVAFLTRREGIYKANIYRPAERLVELGLAQWLPDPRGISGWRVLEATPAGLKWYQMMVEKEV
jgi:hypothetical protein